MTTYKFRQPARPPATDLGTNGADNGNGNGNGNGVWTSVGGWDWNAISQNALQWGYALGWIQPPSSQLDAMAYQTALQQQRQQMMFLVIGIIVLVIVLIVLAFRGAKK